MARLTAKDLETIKSEQREKRALRNDGTRVRITVHMGTCGIAAGAEKIMAVLRSELDAAGAADVAVTTSGCAGFCSREPMATVEVAGQPPVKYAALTEDKIKTITAEHVLGGEPVAKLALARGNEAAY